MHHGPSIANHKNPLRPKAQIGEEKIKSLQSYLNEYYQISQKEKESIRNYFLNSPNTRLKDFAILFSPEVIYNITRINFLHSIINDENNKNGIKIDIKRNFYGRQIRSGIRKSDSNQDIYMVHY